MLVWSFKVFDCCENLKQQASHGRNLQRQRMGRRRRERSPALKEHSKNASFGFYTLHGPVIWHRQAGLKWGLGLGENLVKQKEETDEHRSMPTGGLQTGASHVGG
jgi:hypothetical protein